MIEPRLFLCSGVALSESATQGERRKVLELDALGPSANVTIRVEDVSKIFLKHMSGRILDYLEIAAYVYAADASTRRGSAWENSAIEPWGRDLAFVIPVREPAFWTRPEVQALLVRALQFLSNDRFAFQFTRLSRERPSQEYLALSMAEEWEFRGIDRVMLFSGGLDSLAGAVEWASRGENIVLVSHRSVSTMSSRQRRLFDALRSKFPACKFLHVPVWINRQMSLGKEPTQRTRSFLYSALGAVVAGSLDARGVRFFENGVVSLNLPVAGEALRARASRTTHPEALRSLAELASLVLGRPIVVDNPYLLKTKEDVVTTLLRNGGEGLIGLSVSCAHPMFKSKSQQHCGMCSQCIDRRIAILGAGAASHDPDNDYERDVLLGPREDGYQRNMAVNYARHSTELARLSDAAFAQLYNLELTRAVLSEPILNREGMQVTFLR